MERTPVESSCIQSIGYSRAQRTLEVQFWSESIYQYRDVPPGVFNRWMAAASKGKFFGEEIRGVYEFRQVW